MIHYSLNQNQFYRKFPDYFFAITITIAMFLLFVFAAQGQNNIGINNPTPHAKSLLDLTATDKGLLTPRMTQAQRTAMFPSADATAQGMLVYQTDNTTGFYYYDGVAWQYLGNGTTGWSTIGNVGTNSSTNFMGTTDAQDVVFKSNNSEGMRLKPANKLQIGSTNFTPSYGYARLNIADENGLNSDINLHVASGSYSQLVFDQTGGSIASPTASSNGQWTGVMVGRAYTGTTYGNTSAVIFGIDSTVTSSVIRGNIQFQTAGGSQNEKMRIDRFGNVGIGTTAPFTKLTVFSNDSGYVTAAFKNQNASGWSGQWFVSSGGTLEGHIGYGNATAPKWPNQVYVGSIASVPFVLTTGDIERMRIDATGNVGIGTTAPGAKLDVTGSIRMVDGNQATGKILVSGSTGIGSWQTVAASTLGGWSTTGNSGTSSATNFIGTTDAQALVLRTNNTSRAQFDVDGRVELFGNNHNLTIGQNASNSTFAGTYNTIVGELAGFNGTGGNYNAFYGYQSGRDNNGDNNTFYGYNAGTANNAGISNTCIGMAAGVSNVSGSFNTNIGHAAGSTNTSGSGNTITGYFAGSSATGASNNALFGYHAGYSNTADGNTFIGYQAGSNNTTGTYNTYIGNNAYGSPAITKSVAIGFNATATGSSSVAIGYNASVTANNSLVLGGTGADAVKVGIGVTAPTSELEVNGYTQLGTNAPAIKTLELTGTTGSAQGSQVGIAHGLNSAKILSVDVLVEYSAGSFVHHSYTYNTGYDFSFYITSTSVFVGNTSTNSANILSKPFKIFIIYMQ